MKNPYFKLTLSALLLSIIFFGSGCKKSSTSTTTTTVTAPSITTPGLIINLTSTTAQSGGIITDNGGAAITANGVCYSSTNKTPTVSDSKTTEPLNTSGLSPIVFTSNLTGLTPGTVYYLRAYATNSGGNGYGSVITFTTSSNIASVVATVSTFAGNGTAGYTEGTGLGSVFNNPQGVLADSKGNVYVSDTYNSRIRAITSGGATSLIAGNGTIGYIDGVSASAEFYGPQGLTFDTQGNLYVADFGTNAIRKITTAGVVSTYAGTGVSGQTNGAVSIATLSSPSGMVFDSKGNMFITDEGNNFIRKVNTSGVVTVFAGTKTAGYVNGTTIASSFSGPSSIAIDASDNLYVTDQGNSAIRKITPAGVVTTLAGGPSQTSVLNSPAGIALDKAGNIYITDLSGRVLEITTANVLYVLAGTANVAGFSNGTGSSASFSSPQGITVDASGNIYVADQGNNCIRKITVTVTP
ncbi:NHL repeat-containing protein [Mucilaginibacter sp.]|uniref:NHL repeat-containing protein n=1 Tax=Mucilaginibacter sp. TaxID=1882438 RepID=UPI003D12B7CC